MEFKYLLNPPIHPELERRVLAVKYIVSDFDGVFSDNSVFTNSVGEESLKCSKLDSIVLPVLELLDVGLIVLTSEVNPSVGARCEKLGIPLLRAKGEKTAVLRDWMKTKDLSWEHVCFLGNDLNDIDCLMRVGLPVVPGDCAEELGKCGLLRTRAFGGQGVIREVVKLFYEVRHEV